MFKYQMLLNILFKQKLIINYKKEITLVFIYN